MGCDEPTPRHVIRAGYANRPLQYVGNADGALARELVVVSIGERSNRLVVGMPDDHDTARHLVDRRRNPIERSLEGLVDLGAPGAEEIGPANRHDRSHAVFGHRQEARRFLGRQQLFERWTLHRYRRRCRGNRKVFDPDLCQPGMQGIRLIREPRVVDGKRHRDDGQRGRDDDPPRHVPNQPIALILEAAPSQRQVRCRSTALLADGAIDLRLQIRQLLVAAVEHLILAGEAEREYQVLQLQQIEVPAGIGGDPIQHLEELLAAPRLAVQRHQQWMLRPLALGTRRRGEHRLVETGTQYVPRREDDLVPDSIGARRLLEPPDLFERIPAQRGEIHRGRRGPKLSHQEQQGARRLDERVEAQAQEGARRWRDRLEISQIGRPALEGRRRFWCTAPAGARSWPRRQAGRQEGIVAVRHERSPVLSRELPRIPSSDPENPQGRRWPHRPSP